MAEETLRIAGRRSKLAVIQSEYVKEIVEREFPNYNCTVLAKQTLGDQVQSKPLYSFGGKALWTKELEDLLYEEDLDQRIDMIVHSLKDMPTQLPEGFELGAVTKRVDPSDCLVMAAGSPYKSLSDLPAGSVVGTSSIRRSAQLKRRYPQLVFESVRGNIQTRLKKLDDPENECKCIILATAGLVRLGLESRITQRFDSTIMYHAVGQGALGIETRTGDERVQSILAKVADRNSTICCLAERSLMRTLEGGCSVPIGVNSVFDEQTSTLTLDGIVVSVDGADAAEATVSYKIDSDKEDAIACGQILAAKLVDAGAKKILDAIHLPEA
ncbi:AaceriABL107Cp [[Ashbya] aceris (nom. inval.)]|nr:AaceriABL107Cp [[Ashbya] aceris (nom. inval.)]